MTDAPTDILVVGAGPTGLALALQAHDHGARVRVVERRTAADRPSRALIVHPRTLEVLRPLRVTDELLARGDVSPSVHLHLGSREVATRLGGFDLADTAFPHLLFIPQAVVERILRHALEARGVEVERGVEVVGVHGAGAHQVATARRGGAATELACTYVVGCDGGGSTVRQRAGIGWSGTPYAQEVVLADIELEGDLAPGVAHAVAGGSGLLFLFPLGERATWRLLATRRARAGDAPLGQPGPPVPSHELQDLLTAAGLVARVTEVGWSARVRLQHGIASAYRRDGTFLVGDAAHVHSPAGGQGMNTGLQDACNLGWKLAFAARATGVAAPPEVLLDSYECERRPVARRVIAMTDVLFWAEAGTDPVARFGRRVIAPLGAPAVPVVLRQRSLVARGVRVLSQLGVGYPRSLLSVDGFPQGRRSPQPGARLPDAVVTTSGHRARLHELLAVPGPAVLLERDAASVDVEVVGHAAAVHRIAEWPGTGVLVIRPDGHVGLRSGVVDAGQLERWLALIAAPSGGRPVRPVGSPVPGRAAPP